MASEFLVDAVVGIAWAVFSPGFATAPHAYWDSVEFGLVAFEATGYVGIEVRQPASALAPIKKP